MTRADDYRALRAKYPDYPAKHLWQWASAQKPHALDWDEDGSEAIGTATIDGWDVRAVITDDYDVDASETYGTLTDDYERGAFENPYWREYHKSYGPGLAVDHDAYCRSRHHDESGAARWYVDGSGDTFETLHAYYRKSYARHEAYSRALADYRERANDCRQFVSDRYGQGRYLFAYVSVEVSLAGVVVGEFAYGGYSWERKYTESLDSQLDEIVGEAVREALPRISASAAMEGVAA